jgi:hypothetical protein
MPMSIWGGAIVRATETAVLFLAMADSSVLEGV